MIVFGQVSWPQTIRGLPKIHDQQRSPKAQQVGKKSIKTHPFLKSTAAKWTSKSLPIWFLTGTSTGPQNLPKNMLKTGGSMDVDQKTPHASFAKTVKIQSSDGSIPIRLLCRIHWSPGKRATHCQPGRMETHGHHHVQVQAAALKGMALWLQIWSIKENIPMRSESTRLAVFIKIDTTKTNK